MERDTFWRNQSDDAVLAAYLTEHSYESVVLPNGEMFIAIGDEDNLPPLVDIERCANCATPIAQHGSAGWRHEWGFNIRGGCVRPVQEGRMW